ncbi:MAG: glycosyltransferase family 4 protein [Gemmatimonadota bacterium]
MPSYALRFVNAHYAPDVAATGEFLTDLAEGLTARGHRVHVVTGRLPYGARAASVPDEEVRNGVRVTRVRTTQGGRSGTLRRLSDYATFFLGAAGPVLSGAPADLTVYLTTPPLLGLLGLAQGALGRGRYGLWVMDLHPEAEIAHGMIPPHGTATRFLGALDRRVFAGSSLTAVLGRCMAERVADKVPGQPPRVLPLWRDGGEVRPRPREENPLARRWDVDDRFVLMYSGNAGLAHRFEEIKELLRHFRDDDGVLTLFIGSGPRRRELEAFLSAEGIRNARYLDYLPREEVPWSLPLADVHLLSLEPAWKGIAVPSKVFGIMAAGRPGVMVGPAGAEPARILEEAGAGVVVDPEGVRTPSRRLIDIVEELRADTGLREHMGQRGRKVLLQRFSLEAGLDRWEAALHDVLG